MNPIRRVDQTHEPHSSPGPNDQPVAADHLEGSDTRNDQDPTVGLRFEQAIGQLEHIIDEIESGQIGLEQSLSAYERGMKLIVRCRSILNTAEKRIAELTIEPDGELRAQVDNEDEDEDGDIVCETA